MILCQQLALAESQNAVPATEVEAQVMIASPPKSVIPETATVDVPIAESRTVACIRYGNENKGAFCFTCGVLAGCGALHGVRYFRGNCVVAPHWTDGH